MWNVGINVLLIKGYVSLIEWKMGFKITIAVIVTRAIGEYIVVYLFVRMIVGLMENVWGLINVNVLMGFLVIFVKMTVGVGDMEYVHLRIKTYVNVMRGIGLIRN